MANPTIPHVTETKQKRLVSDDRARAAPCLPLVAAMVRFISLEHSNGCE